MLKFHMYKYNSCYIFRRIIQKQVIEDLGNNSDINLITTIQEPIRIYCRQRSILDVHL